MRAVRLHGAGDLRVEEVAEPGAPGPGEVLLRVRAAGICGSDLHNFRTGQWISRLPTIPGHEFAAEVMAAGAGVDGVAAGSLVVADSRVPCGTCPACRAGRPNVCPRMGYIGEVCDGGFAEFVRLPAHAVLPVPAGVSPTIAALAEPVGVALRVVRRLEPPRDEPILIAGAGPIGGLAAVLLRHLGFGPLAIIERNEARARRVAEIAGAQVLAPDAAAIARFAGADGLGFAIEATGSAEALAMVTGSLRGGGRLAVVGLFKGSPAVTMNAVVERELEVRGCSVFCNEQREAIAMLPELAPVLARALGEPIDLGDVPAEYDRLIRGETGSLKTIIRP